MSRWRFVDPVAFAEATRVFEAGLVICSEIEQGRESLFPALLDYARTGKIDPGIERHFLLRCHAKAGTLTIGEEAELAAATEALREKLAR